MRRTARSYQPELARHRNCLPATLNFQLPKNILQVKLDGMLSHIQRTRHLLDTKYNAEYVAGGYVEPALPRVIRGTVRVNF